MRRELIYLIIFIVLILLIAKWADREVAARASPGRTHYVLVKTEWGWDVVEVEASGGQPEN